MDYQNNTTILVYKRRATVNLMQKREMSKAMRAVESRYLNIGQHLHVYMLNLCRHTVDENIGSIPRKHEICFELFRQSDLCSKIHTYLSLKIYFLQKYIKFNTQLYINTNINMYV